MRPTCVISLISVFPLLMWGCGCTARYAANWTSLDARPLPQWFDQAKIGIFVHWGVFSVPGFGQYSEWFWYWWRSERRKEEVEFMQRNYPLGFRYADFAHEFRAEFFDPDNWAEIFKASGARCGEQLSSWCNSAMKMQQVSFVASVCSATAAPTGVVCLLAGGVQRIGQSSQKSDQNTFNRMPAHFLVSEMHKDINVYMLLQVCGVHIQTPRRIHKLALSRLLELELNGCRSSPGPGGRTGCSCQEETLPELVNLVMAYKPDLIWSDGDWEAPDTYWNSTQFLAWLYNDSPVKDVVVTNDRWGKGCYCKHGGYYNCADRYTPGKLPDHKWEKCQSIDTRSWGYRRDMKLSEVMDLPSIIKDLVYVVAMGGNYLLNIGPMADGMIAPVFEERLRGLGAWLEINGEAIYASRPWRVQTENSTVTVWYTAKNNTVYAIILGWPSKQLLQLTAPRTSGATTVTLMDYPNVPLKWAPVTPAAGLMILMPSMPVSPGKAWALRLEGVV